MIDCSHANSRKDFRRQAEVATDVGQRLADGDRHVVGVMIESHLKEGRQELVAGKPPTYGQSITDACLGWEPSVRLLEQLADAVRQRRDSARRATRRVGAERAR
jgi:3-deoxy-7-phosphoheptulonate synthase